MASVSGCYEIVWNRVEPQLVALAPLAAQTEESPEPDLAQRSSYAIGVNFGRTLAAQGVAINAELLVDGIEDGLSGADTWITDDEMRSAVQQLQQQLAAAQQQRTAVLAEKNQKEGTAFLAANGE